MSLLSIYLDYHATTPVDPRVADRVLHTMTTEFGNASSIDHTWGDRAETTIQQAAQHIATLTDANPKDIIWTSGATESINLAIQGTIKALEKSGIHPHIAITAVEHKAVLDTCHILEQQQRIQLTTLPVNHHACLDLKALEDACASGNLHLLCIMAANNEVGTIYPTETIASIAQRHTIPFLCDASQAIGKIPIQFNQWGITMLALSAHKLYGPKGVGALIVRKGHPLEPLIYGGGHQKGLRSGTLNVSGIVGLGDACRLRSQEMAQDKQRVGAMRDRLQHRLNAQIPNLVVNGDLHHRLAGNLHISIPGIPNSAVIARVRDRLAISTGSACSSGVETPSHVLQAMKLPNDQIEGALRIGIGKFTTDEDIAHAANILTQEIQAIQALL